MMPHNFDVNVNLPNYKQTAGDDFSWIDRELDFRQLTRSGVTDPQDPGVPVFAGSLTCGNTCGVLSIGCGGSGCGGATCQCTQGCTNGCSVGCDFTNSCVCDFTNGCDS